MISSFREVSLTLALSAVLSFGILFFSGTADDITFLITSNSHMTEEVNTISLKVRG